MRSERSANDGPLEVSVVANDTPDPELMEQLEEVGVDRLVIYVGAPERDSALRTFDRLATSLVAGS
jgi:hypothetical protein